MHAFVFFLVLAGLSSPVLAQRESLGIFSQWGAFREANPRRCFAITEPFRGLLRALRAEGWKPFASVGYRPGRGSGGQLHIRLSRQKRPQSAVLLRVDGRTFQLVGAGNNAWAPDRRADAEIVSALRTGIDMIVETRSVTGALVRDQYQLRGAATAIDAAAISCARRG